jgi:hypothetical protein
MVDFRQFSPGIQKVQVEWVTLTPEGVSRIQSGTPIKTDPATKRVYKKLAEMGGRVEVDELSTASQIDQFSMRHSISILQGMGLVQQIQQTPIQG